MSTMHNNTRATPYRQLGASLKVTRPLLILFVSALVVVRLSAQPIEPGSRKTGSILGTVVDINSDLIPGATVALESPAGDRLELVTRDDGTFAFRDVTAGIAYQITVTAEGFAEWRSSVKLEPGEEKTLGEVKLRIAAVERKVTVGYSSKEVASQQLKAEEQQRVLRVIPNLWVTYEPHPEPLTTRMKFHLAYKDATDPTFFARAAAWAGIEQGFDIPDWPQDAQGYGKRLGSALASGAIEDFVGNAALPSLLHQDPRYFYQGTESKGARVRHALLASFVCPGDNGRSQPNYSTWAGSLIASSVSIAYSPHSDRTTGHVFRAFGISMGFHVFGSFAQEFILDKFTSRGKHE